MNSNNQNIPEWAVEAAESLCDASLIAFRSDVAKAARLIAEAHAKADGWNFDMESAPKNHHILLLCWWGGVYNQFQQVGYWLLDENVKDRMWTNGYFNTDEEYAQLPAIAWRELPPLPAPPVVVEDPAQAQLPL
jgi:hypothetical protein